MSPVDQCHCGGEGVKDLGNAPDVTALCFDQFGPVHNAELSRRKVTIEGKEYSLRDPELYAAHPEAIWYYLEFLADIRGQNLEDIQSYCSMDRREKRI